MVKRPDGMNAFEFAVLSSLRAAQLYRGCVPRVVPSEKVPVTAQHEVADLQIVRWDDASHADGEPSIENDLEALRSSD